MKVPSTLKFQQRHCLCSERSCAAQVRSPQSGRSLIILCNIPLNGSSSLLLADGRWTLLGRAHLALTPLLTHIYLLSQNQTCQSLQERRGKSKAIYFSCFSESVIFNMGAVTLRLPQSSLLKGIVFFVCFIFFASPVATSPPAGCLALPVWAVLVAGATLKAEGPTGTRLC